MRGETGQSEGPGEEGGTGSHTENSPKNPLLSTVTANNSEPQHTGNSNAETALL